MNLKLILTYLRDLKKHNDREWFQDTKDRYDEAREEFREFIQQMIDDVGRTEPAWARLDARDCLFRIHRDLRFSKDKTPYKTNFSASLAAGGKSVTDPGIYFAIEPGGQSMIAGGMYQPTPAELVNIRAKIAADPKGFRALATAKPFVKFFPDGINGGVSKTVRGFKPDAPGYEYIRIKSYCAWRNHPDDEVEAKGFAGFAAKSGAALVPLCRWLAAARV